MATQATETSNCRGKVRSLRANTLLYILYTIQAFVHFIYFKTYINIIYITHIYIRYLKKTYAFRILQTL